MGAEDCAKYLQKSKIILKFAGQIIVTVARRRVKDDLHLQIVLFHNPDLECALIKQLNRCHIPSQYGCSNTSSLLQFHRQRGLGRAGEWMTLVCVVLTSATAVDVVNSVIV